MLLLPSSGLAAAAAAASAAAARSFPAALRISFTGKEKQKAPIKMPLSTTISPKRVCAQRFLHQSNAFIYYDSPQTRLSTAIPSSIKRLYLLRFPPNAVEHNDSFSVTRSNLCLPFCKNEAIIPCQTTTPVQVLAACRRIQKRRSCYPPVRELVEIFQ